MHYSYPPLILLHGYNRSLLHTTIDIADKLVGNIDYLARTAVILVISTIRPPGNIDN